MHKKIGKVSNYTKILHSCKKLLDENELVTVNETIQPEKKEDSYV